MDSATKLQRAVWAMAELRNDGYIHRKFGDQLGHIDNALSMHQAAEAKAHAYDDGVICDVDTVGHMDVVRVTATDGVQAQRLRVLAPNRVRVVRDVR